MTIVDVCTSKTAWNVGFTDMGVSLNGGTRVPPFHTPSDDLFSRKTNGFVGVSPTILGKPTSQGWMDFRFCFWSLLQSQNWSLKKINHNSFAAQQKIVLWKLSPQMETHLPKQSMLWNFSDQQTNRTLNGKTLGPFSFHFSHWRFNIPSFKILEGSDFFCCFFSAISDFLWFCFLCARKNPGEDTWKASNRCHGLLVRFRSLCLGSNSPKTYCFADFVLRENSLTCDIWHLFFPLSLTLMGQTSSPNAGDDTVWVLKFPREIGASIIFLKDSSAPRKAVDRRDPAPPGNNGMSYLSSGAGFLPSEVTPAISGWNITPEFRSSAHFYIQRSYNGLALV